MAHRVVLIEDHTLVRQVLTVVLTERAGCRLVATCGTLAEGIAACREHRPDLVILDWMLPDGSGARALEALVPALPATRWLAFSAHENPAALHLALAAGAHGFVFKQSGFEDFEVAIRDVLAGRRALCPRASRLLAESPATDLRAARALTGRERQILALYAQGRNPKAIADQLGLSPKTVQNQLTTLREKLGLHEPAALVRYALDQGLA